MANEIYSSSWWGNFSATGFGNIYYDIALGSELIQRFTTRVEDDAGTVESSSCISNLGLDSYNWDFYYRVIDDAGIVENLECITI
jgi:hypothetical protein